MLAYNIQDLFDILNDTWMGIINSLDKTLKIYQTKQLIIYGGSNIILY